MTILKILLFSRKNEALHWVCIGVLCFGKKKKREDSGQSAGSVDY